MNTNLFLADQKKELESMIIGEVLLENKYVLVGDILSPQNFTNYPEADNRIIWSTIEKMSPTNPIDLLTVSAKVYDWHGNNYRWVLTDYTTRIASSCHIRYHAMMLLELDIRSKLVSSLIRQYEKARGVEAFDTATEIHQIKTHVENPVNDLFDVISTALDFLKGIGYDKEYDAVQNLVGYLPEKIIKIRNESQLESCISNLTKLFESRPGTYSIIEKLTMLIQKIYWDKSPDNQKNYQKVIELLNTI